MLLYEINTKTPLVVLTFYTHLVQQLQVHLTSFHTTQTHIIMRNNEHGSCIPGARLIFNTIDQPE